MDYEANALRLEPPFYAPEVLARHGMTAGDRVPIGWMDDPEQMKVLNQILGESLRLVIAATEPSD